MSYNFKSLGEVELLDKMPENANIIVEIDGATRRAPKEDGIGKLVTVETLEEVPEGATVLAEVNGEIKRVPSDGLGGGTILEIWYTKPVAIPISLDETETAVTSGDFKANMTYAEVLNALRNNKLAGAYFNYDKTSSGDGTYRQIIGGIIYVLMSYVEYIELQAWDNTIYYWSDNTISFDPPTFGS